MKTIKMEYEGQEREFEVTGRTLPKPTHWMNCHGYIYQLGRVDPTQESAEGVMYLQLISPHYTFGGVLFEETGEQRIPVNEWAYHDSHGPSAWFHAEGDTAHHCVILRPVDIVNS